MNLQNSINWNECLLVMAIFLAVNPQPKWNGASTNKFLYQIETHLIIVYLLEYALLTINFRCIMVCWWFCFYHITYFFGLQEVKFWFLEFAWFMYEFLSFSKAKHFALRESRRKFFYVNMEARLFCNLLRWTTWL